MATHRSFNAQTLEGVDEDDCMALYAASCRGFVDIVKGLLEAGADKGRINNDSATPLFIAAQEGHIEVMNALLAAGG